MEWSVLALQVLLTVAAAALVELPVAALYTRRMVRKDVQAEVDSLATRIDALKPAATHPNLLPPQDAAALRWEKAEQKRLAALATKVEVKTFIAEKFGEHRVAQVEALLGPETMDGIYASGERALPILRPMLARMKPMAPPADAKTEPAAGFAME